MTNDEFEYLIGWLDTTKADGALDEVRKRLNRGDFTDGHKRKIEQWIAEEERRQAQAHGQTIEGATVRQAAATEKAVEVALRAAKASERSARWTFWAALAALATAAQPWISARVMTLAPQSQPSAVAPAQPSAVAPPPIMPAENTSPFK